MIIDELEEFKIYITKRYLKLKNNVLDKVEAKEFPELRANLETIALILFKDSHKIITQYINKKDNSEELIDFDKTIKDLEIETKKIKNESTLVYFLAFIFIKIEYIINNYMTLDLKKTECKLEDKDKLLDTFEKTEKIVKRIEKNMDNKNQEILLTYKEIFRYYGSVLDFTARRMEIDEEEFVKIRLINDKILKRILNYGDFGKNFVEVVKSMDSRYKYLKEEEPVKEEKKLTLKEIFKNYNSSVIDYKNREDTFDYDNGLGAFIGLLILIAVIATAIIFG